MLIASGYAAPEGVGEDRAERALHVGAGHLRSDVGDADAGGGQVGRNVGNRFVQRDLERHQVVECNQAAGIDITVATCPPSPAQNEAGVPMRRPRRPIAEAVLDRTPDGPLSRLGHSERIDTTGAVQSITIDLQRDHLLAGLPRLSGDALAWRPA